MFWPSARGDGVRPVTRTPRSPLTPPYPPSPCGMSGSVCSGGSCCFPSQSSEVTPARGCDHMTVTLRGVNVQRALMTQIKPPQKGEIVPGTVEESQSGFLPRTAPSPVGDISFSLKLTEHRRRQGTKWRDGQSATSNLLCCRLIAEEEITAPPADPGPPQSAAPQDAGGLWEHRRTS